MLSYQSLMPAAVGTPRYENEAWSLEVFGGGWRHPSPLDSGPVSGYGACFHRRNDEFGGGFGTIHPGSESGTCFRANDGTRGSAGAMRRYVHHPQAKSHR